MSYHIDDIDKTTRHVSYLASTENRIQFKEVKLVPKSGTHEQQQVNAPTKTENGKGKGKAPITSDGTVSFVEMIAGTSNYGNNNQAEPSTSRKQRGGRKKKATGMNPVQEKGNNSRQASVAEDDSVVDMNEDFGREPSLSTPPSQQDMVLVRDLPDGDDVRSRLNEAGMSMDTSEG
jgi:hypothetical protein